MAIIAAAHDLAGVGRCSLVAAISAISACGHTCYPLPTAILSHQVAFPGFSYCDFTGQMPDYIRGWEGLQVRPDLIYTGFLGGKEQPEILGRFIDGHPDATVVVDPVMADHGILYPCYDEEYVACMRKLVAKAHIITPNPTEFMLLVTGRADAPFPDSDGELLALAAKPDTPRLRRVVISGAGHPDCAENIILDCEEKRVIRVPCVHTGVAYNGSGDLFASILCGCIADNPDIVRAVKTAGTFLSAVALSMADSTEDPRLGMRYEKHLGFLAGLAAETPEHIVR